MEENVQTPEVKGGISKGLIVVILVVVVVLAAGAYEFTKPKGASMVAPSPATSQTETGTTPTAAAMMKESTYKDGTYTSDGAYLSPGGEETVGVSLTLKGGVIEDVTFTPKATRPNSVKFQGLFASGYKPMVLGKNIDEVTLDEVSGSSLTPKGFNDAISKIKEKAKS